MISMANRRTLCLRRKSKFSENVVCDLDLWTHDLENVTMSYGPGNEYLSESRARPWKHVVKYAMTKSEVNTSSPLGTDTKTEHKRRFIYLQHKLYVTRYAMIRETMSTVLQFTSHKLQFLAKK